MTPFSVRRIDDDTIVIEGELDASTAGDLADACDDLGPRATIDCSRCEFIDSAGLSVLLRLRTHVLQQGGALTLIDPSTAVDRVLDISGLAHAFVITRTA